MFSNYYPSVEVKRTKEKEEKEEEEQENKETSKQYWVNCQDQWRSTSEHTHVLRHFPIVCTTDETYRVILYPSS